MKRSEAIDAICVFIDEQVPMADDLLDFIEKEIGMLPPKREKLINKTSRGGVITRYKLMVPEWDKE